MNGCAAYSKQKRVLKVNGHAVIGRAVLEVNARACVLEVNAVPVLDVIGHAGVLEVNDRVCA